MHENCKKIWINAVSLSKFGPVSVKRYKKFAFNVIFLNDRCLSLPNIKLQKNKFHTFQRAYINIQLTSKLFNFFIISQRVALPN